VANLAIVLALTAWKLRFFGSVVGYICSLLWPHALIGILYFVFSELDEVSAGA
jgi:ABC-type polysaccharide/polyol phosphate export permease